MTQGIVSIRKDGQMLYKIVVGHDGMNARKVTSRIRSLAHIPTVEELKTICHEEDFGCPDCLIILEDDPDYYYKPKLHAGKDVEWVEGDPEYQRYLDTFHVAQFNPRWKFGTADYVEVVDVFEKLTGPANHLWSDEQVKELIDRGIISTAPIMNDTDIADDIPF